MKKITREETIILMMKKANEIHKNGWSCDAEMEIWRICSDWNANHEEGEEIGMYENSDENNIVNGFCIEDDSWIFDDRN